MATLGSCARTSVTGVCVPAAAQPGRRYHLWRQIDAGELEAGDHGFLRMGDPGGKEQQDGDHSDRHAHSLYGHQR
jgi:hypothetical protein